MQSLPIATPPEHDRAVTLRPRTQDFLAAVDMVRAMDTVTADDVHTMLLCPFDDIFRCIAQGLQHRAGNTADSFDVVHQAVRESAWQILAVTGFPTHYPTPAFIAVLQRRALQALQSEAEKAAPSGLSGTASQRRKYLSLVKTRSEMSKMLGRSPSDSELVDFYNTRIMATRKDPVRSGAFVSVADLHPPLVDAAADEDLETYQSSRSGGRTNTVEEALIARELVQEILLACGRHPDPVVRQVAHLTLGPSLVGVPPTFDVPALASFLNVSLAAIRCALTEIQRATQTALVDRDAVVAS